MGCRVRSRRPFASYLDDLIGDGGRIVAYDVRIRVGAHGNRTLGTAAIGGMFIGMIFQIFIVPVLFVVFQYLQEKFKPIEWEDLDNSDMSTEIEQYAKTK